MPLTTEKNVDKESKEITTVNLNKCQAGSFLALSGA